MNARRKAESLPEVLFHTDAAQAIGKVKVNVEDLKVDFLSIAGHKVGYMAIRLPETGRGI